jgi:hypothetical protein
MMQAVQVIIERLKSHPEEFFGDFDKHLGRTPKFIDITEKIDDLLTDKDKQYVHRLWYLEPEEKQALIAAYKEARRARFEANVFHTLLTVQEPDLAMERMTPSGKRLMQGPSKIIAPQNIINESIALLTSELDKQYAKNSNP